MLRNRAVVFATAFLLLTGFAALAQSGFTLSFLLPDGTVYGRENIRIWVRAANPDGLSMLRIVTPPTPAEPSGRGTTYIIPSGVKTFIGFSNFDARTAAPGTYTLNAWAYDRSNPPQVKSVSYTLTIR